MRLIQQAIEEEDIDLFEALAEFEKPHEKALFAAVGFNHYREVEDIII